MKRLALLALALSCSAMSADLSEEGKQECKAGSGCILITRVTLNEALKEAYQAGLNRGQVICRSGA